MRILSTITLAKFEDGSVKQIVITPNLSTANIIEAPLAGLVWGVAFEPVLLPPARTIAKPKNIIQTVCDYMRTDYDIVISKAQTRDIVLVRQLCFYFLRVKTKMTLKDMAKEFSGKDHATVIHNLQAIVDMIQTDEDVRTCVSDLEKILIQLPDLNPRPHVGGQRKRMYLIKSNRHSKQLKIAK